MGTSRTRARVIGFALAGLIFGGVAWLIFSQMHGTSTSQVVVVEQGSPGAGLASAAISGPVAGVIIGTDGRPVGNAEVLLATGGNLIDVYNPARRAGPSVRSERDGHFSFSETPTWSDLLVRCPEGFAYLRPNEMPADGRIVLHAWGRVEGVVKSGGKPLGHQTIGAYGSNMPQVVATTNPANPIRYLGNPNRLQLFQSVQTDETGHFVLPRVVPGSLTLSRQILQSSPAGEVTRSYTVAFADVHAGVTTTVEIGGSGRPITGRLVLDRPSTETLAMFGSITLSIDAQQDMGLRIGPDWATLSDQQRNKIVEDWYLRSRRMGLSAPVTFAADGTFRAENIPAGQHRLGVACQARDANDPRIFELLADGSLTFNVPPIVGGRSDEPLDVGAVNVRVHPRIRIGAPAPAVEASKANGGVIKLSDYRGKYLLLSFVYDHGTAQQPNLLQLEQMAGIIHDRFGGEKKLSLLAIMLPQRPSAGTYTLPSVGGWTAAAVQDWKSKLDAGYTSAPGTFLIDPDGKVLAKVSSLGMGAYGLLERALGPLKGTAAGVSTVVEKRYASNATAALDFKTIPTLSKDDAGQSAEFSIVDGRKAGFGGELKILNDGLAPRHDKDEPLMMTFNPGTIEGRIKADMGRVLEVDQINTYSWYKDSHRWAQVYRVYGCSGTEKGLDTEPKIGADPTQFGWSLIASVDTRDTPDGSELKDDVKGQAGVSIRGNAGAMGKYRYLLFVTFATETQNAYGQTFWSEIDVVGR